MHVPCVILQNAWLDLDYLLKQIKHKSRVLETAFEVWKYLAKKTHQNAAQRYSSVGWVFNDQFDLRAGHEAGDVWHLLSAKALPQTGPVNSEPPLWSLSSGSITAEMVKWLGWVRFKVVLIYAHAHTYTERLYMNVPCKHNEQEQRK